MSREQVGAFEGPKGKAEVYEVIETNSIGVEKVAYQVHFGGETSNAATLPEATALANNLCGSSSSRPPA